MAVPTSMARAPAGIALAQRHLSLAQHQLAAHLTRQIRLLALGGCVSALSRATGVRLEAEIAFYSTQIEMLKRFDSKGRPIGAAAQAQAPTTA